MNLARIASLDLRPWVRVLRWILLLLACAVGALALHRASGSAEWPGDLIAYWSAGQLLRQGQNPYGLAALQRIEQDAGLAPGELGVFWNPPWLLLMLYPLLLLPFGMARAVWLVVSAFILVRCGVVTWRRFARPCLSGFRLAPLLATMLFPPTILTIGAGQVSVLMLLGLVGFLCFQEEGHDLRAGASLALLTIKPHVTYLLWPVLLWWVITQRRWRVLGGLLSALASLGVLLWPFRPTWLLDYLPILRRVPHFLPTPLLGTALRLIFGEHRYELQYLPAGVACLLALAVLIRHRAKFAWREAIGPLILVSVPTAAYGWGFDQVVLLLPYLQLVAWLVQSFRTHPLTVWAIALGLVAAAGTIIWLGYVVQGEFYWTSRSRFFWLPGPLLWGGLYIVGRRTLGVSGSQTVPEELASDRATGR